MSERFIRCAHCGLPHDAHVAVCPTTGLRIEHHNRPRGRPRQRHRDREEQQRRMVGLVIDRKYRLRGVIGEGGMSAIYEADHLGLDRRVAIKVLHPSLADDPEAIARLRHEAKVVAAIGHPNICEIFDLGRTDDGSPYLVMELLIGESLADRLKGGGPMLFAELAPLMKQILAALDAAHSKGILHRDLKPENVFIEAPRQMQRQSAKLLDFGISKSMAFEFQEQQRLTHTGMVMGTPYYMAPEQARGDSGLDQRVDLWAVGVIMYEALTGRRPFVATNYNALLVKILTSRPRPCQKLVPTIPDVVAAIVDKALSKLREDRFQTAREFSDALSHAERVCAVEDPQAPTMMFRRPAAQPAARASAQTRPDHPRGASSQPAGSRPWDIDDPATFIDDEEQGYDPTQIPGPLREYQVPAAQEPPGYHDWEADPVEPTIRDRARRDPWAQAEEPHDTERIRRGELEASRSDEPVAESVRDTEVLNRDKIFTDLEKTEVVVGSIPGVEDPTPHAYPREQLPPAPPPSPGRFARQPPRVPRPAVADDEEKTTLFDPEKARALRKAKGDDHAKKGS